MCDTGRPFRLTWAQVVIGLVLGGVLLMLWPGFFVVFFAMLMLLQSCTVEQEMTMMPWTGFSLYVNRLVFLY